MSTQKIITDPDGTRYSVCDNPQVDHPGYPCRHYVDPIVNSPVQLVLARLKRNKFAVGGNVLERIRNTGSLTATRNDATIKVQFTTRGNVLASAGYTGDRQLDLIAHSKDRLGRTLDLIDRYGVCATALEYLGNETQPAIPAP